MTTGRKIRRLLTVLSMWCFWEGCGYVAGVDLADFKSDGCSMFPDGNYYSCCYLHDVAYWSGGTAEEREHADEALRTCILEITQNQALAAVMFQGVRIGGSPELPTSYRWGYGWPFLQHKAYVPLTVQERTQVVEKTQKLCHSLRFDPSTGGFVVGVKREISAAQARQICPDL